MKPGDACDPDGAYIQLRAQRSDGSPTSDTAVQLWLTDGLTARLSNNLVHLPDDGTIEVGCVHPGGQPGTVTLHARSGPVEVMTTLEIRPRTVPAGGTLKISPGAAGGGTPPTARACGDASTCEPGPPRVANILVEGIGSSSDAVPPGATLSLDTDLGELSMADCRAAPTGESAVVSALTAGVAHATACVSDRGGTATLTARSGTVSQTSKLEVPPIPRQLYVAVTPAHAVVGDRVSFTAYASDCAGQGEANVPLHAQVTEGAFEPDPVAPGPIRTGADGSATIAGTVRAVPLKLHVEVLGATQISCLSTVEGVAP